MAPVRIQSNEQFIVFADCTLSGGYCCSAKALLRRTMKALNPWFICSARVAPPACAIRRIVINYKNVGRRQRPQNFVDQPRQVLDLVVCSQCNECTRHGNREDRKNPTTEDPEKI